jgi:hypothetical protein
VKTKLTGGKPALQGVKTDLLKLHIRQRAEIVKKVPILGSEASRDFIGLCGSNPSQKIVYVQNECPGWSPAVLQDIYTATQGLPAAHMNRGQER